MAPRAAIDLMVSYGLTEHRADGNGVTGRADHGAPAGHSWSAGARPRLNISEARVAAYGRALANRPQLIARLTRERGWLFSCMWELGLGFDRGRITIPVRDRRRNLVGLLRYQPWSTTTEPKMLAAAGSRRALLPPPAAETSEHLVLVEGEPDMIAARSRGLPGIAVPGTNGWQSRWASLLTGRRVTIVMDCDDQGRSAAAAIARDLAPVACIRMLDLAPDRDDGYDLTDWLRDRGGSELDRLVDTSVWSRLPRAARRT
jgi:hypothetical protein